MKILYLSCHEILEYDELKLFTDMGHECYSLGAYTMPGGDDSRKRPPIEGMPYDPHFIELSTRYSRDQMHAEMLEGMDMVIVMHVVDWLDSNWPILQQFIAKGGRVVWRSIGQSVPTIEQRLKDYKRQGVELVRYSPREQTIRNNAGADAMIRFYKDPAEFDHWNGVEEQVVNFTQSLKSRGKFTGFEVWQNATLPFPRKVYGPGNEDMGDLNGGMLPYEEQKQKLRDSRVFFYHGTFPASYTLSFMEALMTGTPVVAVGPGLGNGKDFNFQQTYEIPDILVNGKNGFYSDDVGELQSRIRELLNNPGLAKTLSLYGRQTAVQLFGIDTIRRQWALFLDGNAK